jgi:hypothetical protein
VPSSREERRCSLGKDWMDGLKDEVLSDSFGGCAIKVCKSCGVPLTVPHRELDVSRIG